MSTYVGKWDCPACGTKRIPGWENGRAVERCPACGSPCTKKWYMDDGPVILSDPEEIRLAKSKQSWTCGHCGNLNDGSDTDCDACGNPRDEISSDVTTQKKEYKPDEVPDENFHHQRPLHPDEARALRPKKRNPLHSLGIMLGIMLIIFLLIHLATATKEVKVSVNGFSWERSMNIQDYAPRKRESWDYAPSGAYNVSSRQEVHHYNKVFVRRDCRRETYTYKCGVIDNGNGTFTDKYCTDTREVCDDVYRDDPVYKTKYYYTINDWAFHHVEKSSANDHEPHYPEFMAATENPSKWRIGKRTGKYYVLLTEKGGTSHKEEIAFNTWSQLSKGSILSGKKNRYFGGWKGLTD